MNLEILNDLCILINNDDLTKKIKLIDKLIDFKKPALSILSPNARFYEDDEKVQLFIENQRINHGNIIGSDGSLISQNAASPEKYDGLEGMTVLEYVEAYPDSIKE